MKQLGITINILTSGKIRFSLICLVIFILFSNKFFSQNIEEFDLMPPSGHLSEIEILTMDKSGKRVLTYAKDEAIHIWDVRSGKLLRRIPITLSTENNHYFTFINKGTGFAVFDEGLLQIYNIKSGQLIESLETSLYEIKELSLRAEEQEILFYNSQRVIVYNLVEQRVVFDFKPDKKEHYVLKASFQEDTRLYILQKGSFVTRVSNDNNIWEETQFQIDAPGKLSGILAARG